MGVALVMGGGVAMAAAADGLFKGGKAQPNLDAAAQPSADISGLENSRC